MIGNTMGGKKKEFVVYFVFFCVFVCEGRRNVLGDFDKKVKGEKKQGAETKVREKERKRREEGKKR